MKILELLRAFVNSIRSSTDRERLVALYESRIKELTEERNYFRDIAFPVRAVQTEEVSLGEKTNFKPLQVIDTWGGISKRILEHRKSKREQFNKEYKGA